MNMYDYILETPKVAKDLLDNRKKSYKEAIGLLVNKDYDEIVFIGSGSSYNGSFTARYFVEKVLNKRVTCLYPYLVENFEKKLNDKAIYIFVSQSGESRLTYEVVNKIKDMGCDVITLTSNQESSIAKAGNVPIDMNCGEETVPYKTKGYTCTYLSIIVMALEAALEKKSISKKEYEDYIDELYNIVSNLSEIISGTEKWYNENANRLKEGKSVLVVGTGANYGTAIESHLKIIETVRCFTFVYELEEYMHGPQNSLSKDSVIFTINSGGVEDEKVKGLDKFLKSKLNNAYLVGKDGDIPVTLVGREELTPIELTVIFQIIAYRYSVDCGIDLNKRAFEDFDEIVGKKVQK